MGADDLRAAGAPILGADRIRSGYAGGGEPIALDDVTVSLRPGELVVVIGPNGSGKSTLIRSLCRTLRPKGGAVLLDGLNLYDAISARAASLQIGVVPQETSIAFDFSVREVVGMGRAPHQPRFSFATFESESDSAAIDAAMRQADIPREFEQRAVSSLSGGERQRVLIARALAQEALILLLDEPTAALDLRREHEILSWLARLVHEQGRTVLAAVHDLNLAAQYADRVIVLCDGKIASMGRPEEALTDDVLTRVYGVRVLARKHPATGRPYFLTLPRGDESLQRLAGKRIHVICGGGSGGALLSALRWAAADVSAGALHAGDSDIDALGPGDRLHSYIVDAFCSLDSVDRARVTRMAADADCVAVSVGSVGAANLANLEAAADLAGEGKAVIVSSRLRPARGFEAEAAPALARLREAPSAKWVDDPLDALRRAFAPAGL